MAKKKQNKIVAYKHKKLNLYLEAVYIGDGEGEINLVKKLTPNSVFDEEWYLRDILSCSSDGAEYNGEWIDLYPEDFEIEEVEINKK